MINELKNTPAYLLLWIICSLKVNIC